MADYTKPGQAQKRPLVTPKSVSTKKADEATTPLARLIALNESMQALHYSHNEQRRLMREFADTVVTILDDLTTPAKTTRKSKAEPVAED